MNSCDKSNVDFITFLIITIAKRKGIILVSFVVSMFISILYVRTLPNIYKSESTIISVGNDSSVKLSGQLSGLAALAGVNLGSTKNDKTEISLEVLKSREFVIDFIHKNKLEIALIGSKGWNSVDDTLIIDSEIYDTKTNKWNKEKFSKNYGSPSALELYESFIRRLSISMDKNTGVGRISFEHYSPSLSQDILIKIISSLNNKMKISDIEEFERNIQFLNEKISNEKNSELRTLLFSLVEEQTKNLMLATIREEYVFRTIDPSLLPEKHIKPMRPLLVFLGSICGVSLFILFMLIYLRLKLKKDS